MDPSGDDETVAATEAALGGAAAPSMLIPTGELIGDRYQIIRFLGGGGMGNVYAAVDTELGELLAIKVLRHGLTDAAVERFRTEVRLQRRITHRNVARIHDIGEHRGEKLLTMELVDGESLQARLERLGPMPLVELRKLAADVLAGLGAAHAAGIMHLDLKPANILLARDGRAVIADFGIARARGDAGTVAGTPQYMAPEQHTPGGDVDARADLYAFGVMLFELATGERLFSGVTLHELEEEKHAGPLDARAHATGLPPAVAAVIQRCLAFDRDDRPASAAEVAGAVERALRDIAGSGAFPLPPESASGLTATVAVLPLSASADDDYLAAGLAEDLADALSRCGTLRVLPATAARGLAVTGPAAGAALGVDHVVEGSLRRVGDRLRIAVRLVSVRDGYQVWADRRDVLDLDLLAVSDQLADGLAAALSSATTQPRDEIDPRAVDLYLRARHYLRDFWNHSIDETIRLLDEAVRAAPSAPTIAATLATAQVRRWMLVGTPDAEAVARGAAERAMAAAPFHGEARFARAQVRINTGDFVGGAGDLGAAIRLAPLLPEAHYTAGLALHEVEHHDEGARRFAYCLDLDPRMRLQVNTDNARLAALDGDFAAAHRLLDELVSGDTARQAARVVALFRTRLAMWQRVDRREIFAQLGPSDGPQQLLIDRLIERIRHMTRDGELEADAWRAALVSADVASRPLRGRLISMQLLTELAVVDGKPDLAREGIQRLGAAGLIDIGWLKKCPLLVGLAGEAWYGAVMAQVAARAQQIYEAYRAGLVGK
jgi:serine/threonine-protein kinase